MIGKFLVLIVLICFSGLIEFGWIGLMLLWVIFSMVRVCSGMFGCD